MNEKLYSLTNGTLKTAEIFGTVSSELEKTHLST